MARAIGAGRDALPVSGVLWKDPDSGASGVAIELENQSASPILDVELELEPEAGAAEWARVLEGLEKWGHWGTIRRIRFAELPIWIDGYSGALVPDEWPRRDAFLPGKAPAVDMAGKPLDCEARGTCRDEAALEAWGFAERHPLLATFVASLVIGLCMGALARRLVTHPAAFRRVAAALNALALLAAAGAVAAAAMSGGYGIYLATMLVAPAGLALFAWFGGFWINAAMPTRAPPESGAAALESPGG